jgi:hypothetical protein
MIHFLILQRVGLSDFDQNDETAVIYFGTRDKNIVNVKKKKISNNILVVIDF